MFLKMHPGSRASGLRALIWNMILTAFLHLHLFFFSTCYHHYIFFTPPALPKNITGVIVLPLEWGGLFAQHSTDNSVSVCSICVKQRVNTPTFTSGLVGILSLLPFTRQLFYVCLPFQRLSWLPHTQAVRDVRPPVFHWKKMNWTYTPLRRRQHKVWCIATLNSGFELNWI